MIVSRFPVASAAFTCEMTWAVVSGNLTVAALSNAATAARSRFCFAPLRSVPPPKFSAWRNVLPAYGSAFWNTEPISVPVVYGAGHAEVWFFQYPGVQPSGGGATSQLPVAE